MQKMRINEIYACFQYYVLPDSSSSAPSSLAASTRPSPTIYAMTEAPAMMMAVMADPLVP